MKSVTESNQVAKDQVARNQEAVDQKDRYRGGEADKERLSASLQSGVFRSLPR